tara:strand:- start:1385 stop:1666 length:282 start_codon:yes stop_codon:yes gene_type:complete
MNDGMDMPQEYERRYLRFEVLEEHSFTGAELLKNLFNYTKQGLRAVHSEALPPDVDRLLPPFSGTDETPTDVVVRLRRRAMTWKPTNDCGITT